MTKKRDTRLWQICLAAGLLAGLIGCCLPAMWFQETGQYYCRISAVSISGMADDQTMFVRIASQVRKLGSVLQKPEFLIRYLEMKLAVPLLFLGASVIRKRQWYIWLYIGTEFLVLSIHTVLLYGFGGFPMVYGWMPLSWIGTTVRIFLLSRSQIFHK